MPIVEVGREQLGRCVDVIRASFATVAEEFGYTEENCPTHHSFMPADRLGREYQNGCVSLGYYLGDDLVGHVSLADNGGGAYEVKHLAVLPEFRQRGYGRELLDSCKARVMALGGSSIAIGVVDENERLKSWYEANGFASTGTRRFEHLPFTVRYMEWRAEGLRLVPPAPEHERTVWEYRQEYFDGGETVIHGDGGLDRAESYEAWLEKLRSAGHPPEDSGLVPATTYLAMVGGDVVGTIQIRHQLSGYLLAHGGHIGYGVRPSQRRKGYATRMLALALERCGALGIERALVTCDKGNLGSARTIQKNSGVLEDEITEEDGSILQRYWIQLL